MIHWIHNEYIFLLVFEDSDSKSFHPYSNHVRAQQFPHLFPFTIPFLLPPAHLQFSVSSAPFCTFLPSKEFKGLTLQYRICSAIFLLEFIPKSKLIQPCQGAKKNPSYSGETPHPHIYNPGRKHIYWSKLHKPRAFLKKNACSNI